MMRKAGILAVLLLVMLIIYGIVMPSMTEAAARLTIEGARGNYSEVEASRYAIQNVLLNIVGLSVIVAFLFQAIDVLVPLIKRFAKSVVLSAVVLIVAIGAGACSPPREFVAVESNYAAFTVSLTAGIDDASEIEHNEQYWENLSDLRPQIPITRSWVKTGGFLDLPGVWRPSHTVILVPLTEVSREWTQILPGQDADSVEALMVESVDSQGIAVGAVITARIAAEDAALYLAHYGTIAVSDPLATVRYARDLGSVLDSVVRDRVQVVLDREFGQRTVDQAQREKSMIWEIARTEVAAAFAQDGITIEVLGGMNGLVYDNVRIQEAIDESYIREEQQNAAIAGATQTAIYNNALVVSGQAAATATVIAGQANAEVQRAQAEALAENPDSIYLEAVRRWDGQLPDIMDSDSVMPFIPPVAPTAVPVSPTPPA